MAGLTDSMRFIPAEEFYAPSSNAAGPHSLVKVQSSSSFDSKDPLRYAAFLTFDDGTTSLFQFVTPQLWRIRYDPKATAVGDYPDANSRTIVQQSFADLVDELQKQLRRRDPAWNAPIDQPNSCWATTFSEASDQSGWVLSSVQYPSQKAATAGTDGLVVTKAFFRKNPFQIQCTRVIVPQLETFQSPPGTPSASVEKVVWQTTLSEVFTRRPEGPRASNIIFNVVKPGPAQYLGFGEQGGRTVLKSATFMNYFCYDNFNYKKVYNNGPLDPREPLYHSQPFYMEMNGTPGYQNVTATLVDNYSQVFIDLGQLNAGRIGLGVRFGILDTYIIAADAVPQLIWLFTSIVGRPKLKPRYVLGHHQGGYGYETRRQLEDVVNNYRSYGIPLDGLAIDVDFQHKYRTFTVDDGHFPNVQEMFANFKAAGIKCCTNITPILSFDGYRTSDDPYPTINAAWDQDDHTNPAKNFLVMDNRFLDGLSSTDPQAQQYLRYDSGQPQIKHPSYKEERDPFKDGIDNYDFPKNFNSGFPFHGGVSYGDKLGIAGFYPDLNREVVREQFWGPQYKDLFDKGLEFVWQDMTTPAVASWYGDMLGFPGRLLISTDPYNQKAEVLPEQKPAIEIWALYSYNLHKATYKALEIMPGRENKRNFIIGRGSSTGMHRFSGLWTGDNASTWDFWRINVAQVIALGLGGITIAGVDMGGFGPGDDKGLWCDPDLFIRWYSGAFLLPWYRNHYNGKQQNKLFQEVYKFSRIQQDYPGKFNIPADQIDLYNSVTPICKYFVRLRYSLMQALYDRMFENLINGLPIARSMLITDPGDTSLLNESARFLDNQYLLGHYILVCPVMDPDNTYGGNRQVYLPRPNSWFIFNLTIDMSPKDQYGQALSKPLEGGSLFTYYAKIRSDPSTWQYLTPIYIREGAIIPQIGVRQYIGDTKSNPNPITLHVYPGQDNWYSMYLDDGVSRSSAPSNLPQYNNIEITSVSSVSDEYREVRITQTTSGTHRKIRLEHIHDNYDPTGDIGKTYTVVIWQLAGPYRNQPYPEVTFNDQQGNPVAGCSFEYRSDLLATIATIPVSLPSSGLVIEHSLQGVGANGVANGVNGVH